MKKAILFLGLMLVLCIGLAQAASLSLGTTTWRQNTKVNITLGTPTACTAYCGNTTKYVTVFAACSNTANSSISKIINITNSSNTNFNNGYANFSFKSGIVLEDSSACSITAKTTGNGAGDSVLLAATTVVIDRTAPSTPTTTQAQDTEFEAGDTISYSVTGSSTTACHIQFLASAGTPNFVGSNTYTMAHSGNTCVYTIPVTLADAAYSVYARATDGLNNTIASSKLSAVVDISTGAGGDDLGDIGAEIGGTVQQNNMNKALLIVGIFAVLYIFLYGKK